MPLLQPIAGRAYYLPGANNLGIVATGDGGAIAIDTGLDKDTGRLIRKALDEAGLTLRAIVNTHHHADHIGGNDYLVRNIPGLTVLAPRLEAALIEHPLLEPIYLNMGAAPLNALRNKWLMAKGTPVDRIIDGARMVVDGVELEVLTLPGHSVNQVGLAVDGVCFAADGFFGPAILQKHGIPYAHDVGEQLASLGRLAARGDLFFLPGHGDLTARDALEEVLAANQAAIARSTELVREALGKPGMLHAIARRVQASLDLSLAAIPQYAIFVSAVAAHLSYLEARGQAQVELEDEGMVWRSMTG
ncbi:MAG TPA: MBL fold metallo-hydrolase [Roseiflexaceae bacterium]|nr:MBL fold metallo-hydrolase [Roseiflexaceae bacterium]